MPAGESISRPAWVSALGWLLSLVNLFLGAWVFALMVEAAWVSAVADLAVEVREREPLSLIDKYFLDALRQPVLAIAYAILFSVTAVYPYKAAWWRIRLGANVFVIILSSAILLNAGRVLGL